jgi:sulfonate transport system permease protein
MQIHAWIARSDVNTMRFLPIQPGVAGLPRRKPMTEALARAAPPAPARNRESAALSQRRAQPPLSRQQLTWLSWAAPLVVLLVWEAVARLGWLSAQVLPAPSKVFGTAVELLREGRLLSHLGVSLLRAATGFVVGGAIGFGLGTLVGFSRLAEALLDRSIQMVRAIPFLALLPLVIVWFGVDEGGKIFLVALGVSFPIYINTVLGIRQVDPKLLELGRVIGLSTPTLVRRIVLPGALPSILTGVRYALATAWLALVVAETIATSTGIGFLAMDAREFLRTDVIVLAILIYALIGVAADSIARLLERRLLSWHANYAVEGGR